MKSKATTLSYNCGREANSELAHYLSERTNYTKYTGMGVLNVFLLSTVVFLMTCFVVVSNIVTSSNYRIGLLSEELSGLTEINAILTAKKLSIEDSLVILNFAQNHHLIEAGHVTHIFESGNVALQR